MPKEVELRALTEKERETLEKLTKSQTAPAIEVERAKTIWLVHSGETVKAISQKFDRTQATIYSRRSAKDKGERRSSKCGQERVQIEHFVFSFQTGCA